MKKAQLLLAIILVSIGCALTYHVFENVVHATIDLIWHDWLNTDDRRLLVAPLTLALGIAYFGLQHRLDKRSENGEEYGLGNMPSPTTSNYAKVLLLGFLSLIAGASLGPEAILVPACMILGAMAGKKLTGGGGATKLLTAVAIIALFTAFFHSLLVGVLSVLLVTKQAKVKLSPVLLFSGVLAATVSYYTLLLVDGKSYFDVPEYNWGVGATTVLISVGLAAAGYAAIYGLHHLLGLAEKCRGIAQKRGWLANALLASTGLSILYLIGGPLIEFTGNQSVGPLFDEYEALGLTGLLVVLAAKIAAMAWSKGMGYRGGMIFPTLFVAAVIIAMVQLYVQEFNMIYGLIAVLAGAFIADSKTHVLA